jgi:hypothetical protein
MRQKAQVVKRTAGNAERQPTVFDKFSKEVLIAFILEEGFAFRYRKVEELEHKLGCLRWEIESKKALKLINEKTAVVLAEDCTTPAGHMRWLKANIELKKAQRRFDATMRLFDKLYPPEKPAHA